MNILYLPSLALAMNTMNSTTNMRTLTKVRFLSWVSCSSAKIKHDDSSLLLESPPELWWSLVHQISGIGTPTLWTVVVSPIVLEAATDEEEEVTTSVAKMTAGGAVICSGVAAEAWSEVVVGPVKGNIGILVRVRTMSHLARDNCCWCYKLYTVWRR